MSLRGESGVTRDRGRSWFYQNWFVFLIVGCLAAVGAWALIEPYLNDYEYFQGDIQEIESTDTKLRLIRNDRNDETPARLSLARIIIRDQPIILWKGTKEIKADGSRVKVNPLELERGQTVGVYVHMERVEDKILPFAVFLVRSPPPQPAAEAAMTLPQMVTRSHAASLLLFPLVAGLVGLAIGAADGFVCRLPRRALLSGLVGLLVGFIGGFISHILANLVYAPLNQLAMNQGDATHFSTFGFFVQMVGRSLAWMLAGMAMGLGQGIALRSKRLLLYGFLGGIVGGLLGGLFFDPIDLLLLGRDHSSAHWSRLISLGIIGATVGAMIGVVELLARDAWLRMTQGPLAGKEFLIFKDVLKVGSSPRSDIYLFNDPAVAPHHATIRALGEECDLENNHRDQPVLLNNRPVRSSRLRHGDQITIGRTVFVFQKKTG
jgi:hypothetical protein